MLKKTIGYSLLSFSILGLSACTSGRTITINTDNINAEHQRPIIVAPVKRTEIKEEILLGRNGNNSNANLGDRINIPLNNPAIGEVLEENITEDRVALNEVIERISFPAEEYKYIKKRGRNTVSGRIYLENSHSSLQINGKKIKLWLNPVTSYSRQWYEESYLGGYKLSKIDKRLYNYLKFTYSDASGKFNFFGLPSGDYYLTGTISCANECGFSNKKSIRLVREISVGRGVTTVDLMKHVP